MKKFYTGDTVILIKDFLLHISVLNNEENKATIKFKKYKVFRILDVNASWFMLESNNGRYMFSNETMQEYFDIKENVYND